MPRAFESRFTVTFRPDGSLNLVSFDATDYDASTLEIPAQISGRPVKALEIVFSETDDLELESIILPDGLERVNDGTFESCDKLKKIVIPASVREIG
ncbi:MAG: leucine-rich repeat protein, partial [Thermoguttaceae bacterium]|nr:leucine-rich repeat protein [Thermoguttaceae bacterium]